MALNLGSVVTVGDSYSRGRNNLFTVSYTRWTNAFVRSKIYPGFKRRKKIRKGAVNGPFSDEKHWNWELGLSCTYDRHKKWNKT